MPDDLWRIVFAFAGPTPGARQVAARARTLVEFVDYRLTGEPDNYHESRTIEEGVAHTGAQINLTPRTRSLVATRFYVPSRWRFPNSASSCTPTNRAKPKGARHAMVGGTRAAATTGRTRSSSSRVLRAHAFLIYHKILITHKIPAGKRSRERRPASRSPNTSLADLPRQAVERAEELLALLGAVLALLPHRRREPRAEGFAAPRL